MVIIRRNMRKTDRKSNAAGPDEELNFKKPTEAPKRSHRLFSVGWFFELAQKRYYKTVGGKK